MPRPKKNVPVETDLAEQIVRKVVEALPKDKSLMPRFLDTEAAEEYLGLGSGYLRDWRSTGSSEKRRKLQPPPHIELSDKKKIYDRLDLDKWADQLPRTQVP